MTGSLVAQVCGSCDRSWHDHAVFCGACGERLEGAALARTRPAAAGHEPQAGRRWRWVVLGAVVAVAAALAVPTLQLGSTSPVPGEVGVPDSDEVQPAVADDQPLATPSADPTPTPVPPPNVSCFHGTSRVEFPCVLWIRRVHAPGSTGLEMTVAAGDRVVSIGPGRLRGYATPTGQQVWEQPLDRPVDIADVAGDTGVLHYGGRAQAFALEDGEWLWGADAFSPLYGQTVADDRVLTSDRDEDGPKLVVHGARDGTARWTARTDGATIFSVVTSSARGALVLTHGNQLVFLDRETGGPAWTLPEGAEVLDVADDAALVVTRGGDQDDTMVQSIALPTGSVRWERTVPGGDVPLVTQGDRLLAATATHLTAIEAATGQVAWRVPTSGAATLASGPGVRGRDGDSPVVLTWSSGGALQGRDRDSGTPLWQHAAPAGRDTVMHRDGLVFVGTPDGLEALDAISGEQLMRVHADGPLQPVGMDPELAIDHRSGYVVGFDFPTRGALVDDE